MYAPWLAHPAPQEVLLRFPTAIRYPLLQSERPAEKKIERFVTVLVEPGSQIQGAERAVHPKEQATVGSQIIETHVAALEPGISCLKG